MNNRDVLAALSHNTSAHSSSTVRHDSKTALQNGGDNGNIRPVPQQFSVADRLVFLETLFSDFIITINIIIIILKTVSFQ